MLIQCIYTHHPLPHSAIYTQTITSPPNIPSRITAKSGVYCMLYSRIWIKYAQASIVCVYMDVSRIYICLNDSRVRNETSTRLVRTSKRRAGDPHDAQCLAWAQRLRRRRRVPHLHRANGWDTRTPGLTQSRAGEYVCVCVLIFTNPVLIIIYLRWPLSAWGQTLISGRIERWACVRWSSTCVHHLRYT